MISDTANGLYKHILYYLFIYFYFFLDFQNIESFTMVWHLKNIQVSDINAGKVLISAILLCLLTKKTDT